MYKNTKKICIFLVFSFNDYLLPFHNISILGTYEV